MIKNNLIRNEISCETEKLDLFYGKRDGNNKFDAILDDRNI